MVADATRRNCEALGSPERYDAELTRRWWAGIADAVEETRARDAEELLRERPGLLRSDLFGLPGWRRA
ncbi:MAG: hypothetical protein ICV67_02125 [Thermoleophilia bacterium]|nr:hypothetical protein [Thermoleophilia bacterium]